MFGQWFIHVVENKQMDTGSTGLAKDKINENGWLKGSGVLNKQVPQCVSFSQVVSIERTQIQRDRVIPDELS